MVKDLIYRAVEKPLYVMIHLEDCKYKPFGASILFGSWSLIFRASILEGLVWAMPDQNLRSPALLCKPIALPVSEGIMPHNYMLDAMIHSMHSTTMQI